ncbi:MAG: MFS transporter [Alcaligenaceae bacterium]
MKLLLLALGAMFFQQTFIALGRALPAVLAPAMISDLMLDSAWIGVYFSISAVASLATQLGCGSFIIRYGSLRMSQVALVMLALGMALSTIGTPLMLVLSALIGGGGAAVSTPSSSHLLGRVSPPRYMPLVFSLKQTAVPAGLLLAGLLGPQLTEAFNWHYAMLFAALSCIIFTVMLQPLRKLFDQDRVPTRTFHLSDFGTTLKSVLGTRGLRNLAYTCFAFNAAQTIFTVYFVVYLTSLGYTLVAAGFVFSTAVAIAVPGRIVWGLLGSGYIQPRIVMAILAIGMAISMVLLSLCQTGWPTILIGIIATIISATALSWHGVLLAETANAAPEGMRGAVTGGVLSFGQLGALTAPTIFSILLGLSNSYSLGFIVCAIPALLVGIALVRQRTR